MLKAVIFDLEGVVADSHPIHEAAWKALLAEEEVRVLPEEAVVAEDSVAGVQAVQAVGMRCVAYALPQRMSSLRHAGADILIAEFALDSVRYFHIEFDLQTHAARSVGIMTRQGD
jgi:beta-phosphoglucomutase-like phosphatase (HAD superfamily)